MDELEWLKEQKPSARPSRGVTRRHRTQLRAAIATEGADGPRPRRARRARRSRHRVLVTTTVVVALCAVGAGVVALTSSGGGDKTEVGAPSDQATTTTATPEACTSGPPEQLAIPEGFGSPVAAPAEDATTAPLATQQVTRWSSGSTTIEERWPADAGVAAQLGSSPPTDGSISSAADQRVQVGANGVLHRTIVFSFGGQPSGCSNLQVTVYGTEAAAVDEAATALVDTPFVSTEPLVTTTGATATAPAVVACEGAVRDGTKGVVATVGGPVNATSFHQPSDALAEFLRGDRMLPQRGYQELHLDDSSIAYAAPGPDGNVVTTVHVVPDAGGWTVRDWQASGC